MTAAMTVAEAATAVLDLIGSDLVPRVGAPWERIEACDAVAGSLSTGEQVLAAIAAELWTGRPSGASVCRLGQLDRSTCAAVLAVLAARYTPA